MDPQVNSKVRSSKDILPVFDPPAQQLFGSEEAKHAELAPIATWSLAKAEAALSSNKHDLTIILNQGERLSCDCRDETRLYAQINNSKI